MLTKSLLLFNNFCNSLIFFLKMFFRENFRNYIANKTVIENKSQRLVVLSNGPSLKDNIIQILNQDFEYIDSDFIMMNFAASMDEFYQIRPKFFVISDPLFYNMDKYNKERVLKLYDNLNTRVDWVLNVYVQYPWIKDPDYVKIFKNSFLNIVPMHSLIYNGIEKFRFPLMMRGFASANFGTVLHHAIHIGIILKYKKIDLYGADHTFFDGLIVTDKNEVCRRTEHVYDSNGIIEPLYHYFTGEKVPYTMTFFLKEYAKLYEGHEIMKAFADYYNVKIINRTKHSMLDCYPRF